MQSSELQDHWEGCSQLLWGMLEVAAGPWEQNGQVEWRKDQPVHVWREKELQEQKVPSLCGIHAHGREAEGLHIQHEFLLTSFLHPWSFKVPHSTQTGFELFCYAAVVFSLYILLDPLKTHTKLEAPFYWVLLKYSPMSQWACRITRQNKEGGPVGTATGMWLL